MKTPALILAASAALAACAPTGMQNADAGADAPRACFYADQVADFRSGPSDTVYVRSIQNTVYEVSAVSSCPDLNATRVLSLQTFGGVSNRLCTGDWAVAQVADPSPGSSVCRVRIVRALTTEQVDALEPRHRP
jgi:hypothetical protein